MKKGNCTENTKKNNKKLHPILAPHFPPKNLVHMVLLKKKKKKKSEREVIEIAMEDTKLTLLTNTVCLPCKLKRVYRTK